MNRNATLAGVMAGVLLSCALGGTARATSLITNGGFETPDISFYTLYPDGSTGITGWTVAKLPGATVSSAQLTDSSAFGGLGVVASEGRQFVDLTGIQGRGIGLVSNAFATAKGKKYVVSFDVGAFYVGAGPFGNVVVDYYLNGSKLGSASNVLDLKSAGSDWQRFSYQFTATGKLTTIGFYSSLSTASSDLGVGLDAVSVDLRPTTGAVPEPATWALMLAGFGVVGAAARRRRPLAA